MSRIQCQTLRYYLTYSLTLNGLITWFLLNFQPVGSDGTISDEDNFENDRVESDFDDASTSSGEDEYDDDLQEEYIDWQDYIFNEGYRELDSDFFLKEPSSGIGLFFHHKHK